MSALTSNLAERQAPARRGARLHVAARCDRRGL